MMDSPAPVLRRAIRPTGRLRPSLAAALAVLALNACGDARSGVDTRSPRALSSFVAGPYGLSVDRASELAIWTNPSTGRMQTEALGGDAFVVEPSRDGKSLYLLHREQELLELRRGPGDTTVYPLRSPFSRLVQSPDGARIVLMHMDTGDAGTASNAGEIAVLDPSRPPGPDNPSLRTVHASQAGPRGISFGPEIEAAGGTIRPALVHLNGRLALIDLDRTDRPETLIALSPAPDSAPRNARQVRFEPAVRQDGSLSALVLVEGSLDLLVLSLVPDPSLEPDRLPLAVQINAHGLGGAPVSVEPLQGSDGGHRALVATRSPHAASLVDLDTGIIRSVPLKRAPTGVEHIEEGGRDHPGPTLLIRTSGPELYLLSAPELESQGLSALRTTRLAATPDRLLPCPGFGLVLATYPNLSRAAFVDLNRSDQVIPLQLPSLAMDVQVDAASGLVAMLDGASPANLILITLGDLHPEVLPMDFQGERLLRLSSGWLAVPALTAAVPEGAISYVPHPSPNAEPDDIITFYGLTFSDILDR